MQAARQGRHDEYPTECGSLQKDDPGDPDEDA
jgi:hypothetical protein